VRGRVLLVFRGFVPDYIYCHKLLKGVAGRPEIRLKWPRVPKSREKPKAKQLARYSYRTNEPSLLLEENSKRVGMARRPLSRIYRIHEEIMSGSYPNCTSLAEEFGVERKTIQRDITFMRDELRLPVVYDEQTHGYFYTTDVSGFPVFKTTTQELAGLFLARRALESVRGTPMADTLRSAFARLTRGMMGQVRFSWADLDEAFSRKVVEQNPRDVRRFGEIAKAVLDRRELHFHYRKLHAERAELRRVRPLHLGEVEGGWYLIGFDLDRGALRTFALPRMSRLQKMPTRFERPPGFVGADYLKRSFGIWNVAGDESRNVVRVELSGYAAQLAQERRWHPSQETIVLNSRATRVEVRFEVGSLVEVQRWVLSFGHRAKVLAPPELATMVRDEVRKMADS
jgi:predicted DNA-binding transcriptional regulator YafY